MTVATPKRELKNLAEPHRAEVSLCLFQAQKGGYGESEGSGGKRLGRSPVPPVQLQKIVSLREQGLSYRKIANRVGLSVGKVDEAVSRA